MRRRALIGLLATLGCWSMAEATVRFTEGVTRDFPVLRTLSGAKLGQGDLVQVARADRVESRLVFRFGDGSVHDQTVVFSSGGCFACSPTVQRGPSFPEASIDRTTERYGVRYRGDEEAPERPRHSSGSRGPPSSWEPSRRRPGVAVAPLD